MNPLSPGRILRICLAGAAALVLVAPAGARVLPIDESDGSMVSHYGWGAAATVAKRQSNTLVAQYGWGATATVAKQQTDAALASRLRRALSTET